MERRKFTREFKLEAVRLIMDRGVSYAQASQDLDDSLLNLDRCERRARALAKRALSQERNKRDLVSAGSPTGKRRLKPPGRSAGAGPPIP
jgi:transposase-like protein